jgi:site-specific DNA recombinase
MHVAAYARVSTQRQAEEQTITQQLDRLHAHARTAGWTIMPQHLYRDEGYSGARIDRPALDRLRDAAERGEFQIVLVTAPDRLARRFVHQTLLLEELGQGGCTVVFLDRPISQDPHDQLLLQIRGAVAEYERALIADRTRRGRLAKLRVGQLLPWIHTPYGYRCDPQYPRDPARWRIEESEANVIRQMFSWYADEGLSIHAIAARLVQRQVPTYHGGWHWHPATVRGMLSNEVYAGMAYGNRDYEVEPRRWRGGRSAVERQRHHTRHRPREEWIAVEVPAIISRELFERVQALRPLRQAQARRNNTRYEYLLRARVSCAGCGLAAVGRPEGRHTYYVGNGHQSRGYTGRLQSCAVRSIRTDRLDPWVWNDVCRLLTTPQLITEALRKAHAGELFHDEANERLRHLQRARQKMERQVERLVDAFTAEVLTLEELKTRRGGLQERIHVLTQQEQELRQQQHQQVRLTELAANIAGLCQAIGSGLPTLDFAGRRKIIELLIDRVILSQDEIEIRYAIPLTGISPAGKKETLRLPYRALSELAQSLSPDLSALG